MVKVASAPEHPIEDSEEDSESSSGWDRTSNIMDK
jgi:hypothetical protein